MAKKRGKTYSNKTYNLIILGPPGAGKGTQAKIIADKLKIPHLSTGEALRNEMEQETELGKKVGEIISSGHLVSDEIVLKIVKQNLIINSGKGFILDGFPRNLKQAEELDRLFEELDIKNVKAINLELDNVEIAERLAKRAKIEGRKDDNEGIIKKRMEIYAAETKPILDYYRNEGELVNVNGMGKVEEITWRILKILDN